jgi:hypothetical protein
VISKSLKIIEKKKRKKKAGGRKEGKNLCQEQIKSKIHDII